jgi:hypothetical protein
MEDILFCPVRVRPRSAARAKIPASMIEPSDASGYPALI